MTYLENRRQIYNAKQASKINSETHSSLSGSVPQSDTLVHVMQVCKETSSSMDAFIAFIQSVEAAPEPMCVLATNQQLADPKCIQKSCEPNLSAIATQALPSGSGRKGGVPKRKRRSVTSIESRSVRQ